MPSRQRGQRQSGFSLVEGLVALLVLSVGLLGLAQLHTKGLRYMQNAKSIGLASNLAMDMAERIRANGQGAGNGDYDSITGTETDPGCSVCTPAQRAQKDAYEWNQAIDAALGSAATGTVSIDANGIYTVTVTWTETVNADLDRGNQTFALSFQP